MAVLAFSGRRALSADSISARRLGSNSRSTRLDVTRSSSLSIGIERPLQDTLPLLAQFHRCNSDRLCRLSRCRWADAVDPTTAFKMCRGRQCCLGVSRVFATLVVSELVALRWLDRKLMSAMTCQSGSAATCVSSSRGCCQPDAVIGMQDLPSVSRSSA